MKNKAKLDEKLEKLKQNIQKDTTARVPPVKTPRKKVDLKDWRNSITKKFPELTFAAETMASVICQLLINDITNPFGLVLIDVPSAGKTIALNFFAGIDSIVYSTDKFSPASFVSHAVNVKKEVLEKIDLLPRIRHRVLMVRDLASVFSEREEDLSKNIGILTRVFDGEGLQTDTGVHGQRGYSGDYCFMFLAASTPIPPRVWKMMGNFGSRLFFLGIDSTEKNEDELVNQLKNSTCRDKEKQCRVATKDFISTIFSEYPNGVNWEHSKEDSKCMKIIARAAKLLACLRAPINIWKEFNSDNTVDHSIPIKEMPDRINQLLYNLARGHALVCERRQIAMDDIKTVLEVTFSSAPAQRVKAFKALLENNGELITNQAMAALNCSRPTAIKELEALTILKITKTVSEENDMEKKQKHIKLKDEFAWFLGDECKSLRGIQIPVTRGQISFTENPHKANPTPYGTSPTP